MHILEQILSHKREEVAAAKWARPERDLAREANDQPPPRPFRDAIRRPPGAALPRLIAEVKRSSPSRGVLRSSLDPDSLAVRYEKGGASAVSVLTDERFFGGSLADLRAVRAACRLPILRKDFIIDPYQVVQSRACGADSVLLIASAFGPGSAAGSEALPAPLLGELAGRVRALGMVPLLEAHDERDLDRALAAGADMIGINNRDLGTFGVDLRVTTTLAPRIPNGIVVVSESGFHCRRDVTLVAGLRVDALLVGESLVTSDDIEQKIRDLVGEECA